MKKIIFAIAVVTISVGTYSFVTKQQLEGTEIGMFAPNIKFKNPNDSVISLSSIKGKMVLIDFWASWCGPCRKENPAVVAAYNKFKDEKFKGGDGFTIFSVSLDQQKDKWVQAIAKDNLTWAYHVSDLKGWQSEPAAKYGVQSIPANWLINAKGIIIAKNLRGFELEAELEKQLLKK